MIGQRTSVGLDVHARSVVACGLDGQTGATVRAASDSGSRRAAGLVAVSARAGRGDHDAGPTGFRVARFLAEQEIPCLVAAPSKLQRPAGDRVKTDVRDARHLARLLHLGEIVTVSVPRVEQEAARDLVRARESARRELMAARHRLGKLLLRHGVVYAGGRTWMVRHEYWLRTQRLPMPGTQLAYETAYAAMVAARSRRDRLDEAITDLAAGPAYAPMVTRLGCLRGISTLTALALTVEVGDWQRLTGRTIGAFLGLVSTEYSSGETRSRGAITKTGNGHARRLLVEAAWHPASPTASRPSCIAAGSTPHRPRASAGSAATDACTPAGRPLTPAASARSWRTP
jgi:transposase